MNSVIGNNHVIDFVEEYKDFPKDDNGPGTIQIQDIKDVLLSYKGPYPRFEGYYRLEDIIDQYMIMWFEETTSSD